MVNRPEGPTLTKSYRQEVLSCARKDRRTKIFSWIVCVIFDGADECIGMEGGMKKRATVQRAGGQMEQDGEVCF